MFGKIILFLVTLIITDIDSATERRNVLLLIADDLRPEPTAFHGSQWPEMFPGIHTPNLDALASRSVVFRRAYVQQALCTPSRASFLTSRRPDTTHVYGNNHSFRETGGQNWTTLPQYFKQHGYVALGAAKVFHLEDSASWSRPFFWPQMKYYIDNITSKTKSWEAVPAKMYTKSPLPDQQSATQALEWLDEFQSSEDNFFLALGFKKPHLPFVFPERYFDFYPLDDIKQPANPYASENMPKVAWNDWLELRSFQDIASLGINGNMNNTLDEITTRDLRRAYYSSVTYIDDLIGQVLNKLASSSMADNTIIAMLGDHGWMLGEHGAWTKYSNYELATRAPLMIHVPGLTDQGKVVDDLVEFVDLYPTVVELAGLPSVEQCPEDSESIPICTEGSSLLPLMMPSSTMTWKNRVFSQFPHRNIMGYSMRTNRFRYTEWVNFDRVTSQPLWNEPVVAAELYDHMVDPMENHNVADHPDYKMRREELSEYLREGWRSALPHPRVTKEN